MLNTLTWGDFYSFILPLLLVYYLFVVLKYYRHELVAVFSSKNTGPRKDAVASASAAAPLAEPTKVPEVSSGQPELFVGQEQGLPAVGGLEQGRQSPEMFKVMASAVAALKEVVAEGVEGHLPKEQLLMKVKEVLVGYDRLKSTPYEAAINSFLTRTCASNFSLVLEEADCTALWG